ncbi:MAG: hypothetical protein AAFP20_14700 [Cyanobacteria bacterium J06614_10]
MENKESNKEVYLQVDFCSSDATHSLQKIELLGIPGERSEDGGYVVNERVNRFFEELLAKELFRESIKLTQFPVNTLKIWLYDTSISEEDRDYHLPEIKGKDLEINSPLSSSELERVFVIDKGFSGKDYEVWKSSCKELVTPLFSRFVPPPDPPEILKEFLVMKFGEELSSKLDLYLSMRKNMFFNALIVQIL